MQEESEKRVEEARQKYFLVLDDRAREENIKENTYEIEE